MARRSSSAAAEASERPLASSSVAAAIRSESRSWPAAGRDLRARIDGAAAAGAASREAATAAARLPIFDVLTRAMVFLRQLRTPGGGGLPF